MTLAYVLALLVVVAIVVMTRQPTIPRDAGLGAPVDALDASIRQLADRVTISESFNRKLRLLVRVLGVVLVVVTLILVAVKQQGDDIVAARKEGRLGICSITQTQTDALARATHASDADLAAYVADLNRGTSAIGCTIVVHPAGDPTSGG